MPKTRLLRQVLEIISLRRGRRSMPRQLTKGYDEERVGRVGMEKEEHNILWRQEDV